MNTNPFHGPQGALPLVLYENIFQAQAVVVQLAFTAAFVLLALVLILFMLARLFGRRSTRKGRVRGLVMAPVHWAKSSSANESLFSRALAYGRATHRQDPRSGRPAQVPAIAAPVPQPADSRPTGCARGSAGGSSSNRSPQDGAVAGDGADRPFGLRQVHLPPDPQPDARARPRRPVGRTGEARRSRHLRRRHRATESRKNIGMVFQKPNPFPAMTIDENVLAGLKFSRVKLPPDRRRRSSRRCSRKAGLWNEVKNRLSEPGGSLSGRAAAAALHRPCARRRPGHADGRTVLGARPDLDETDRGNDPRDRRRGDGRHRDPQHAAGAAGLRQVRLLPRGQGTPGASSRRGDRSDVLQSLRPTDGRLRAREVRSASDVGSPTCALRWSWPGWRVALMGHTPRSAPVRANPS